MVDFRDLGVSDGTLQSLNTMGFEEPTPIQAQAIPLLLAGRDMIAQALTGTGKTAAFGVPIVERIDPSIRRPQAIVLAPTRELAVQVTDQISKIGHYRGIQVLPIYGGQPIGRQLHMLNRGVHAIVATPGRLLDHMRRGSIDLGAVSTLILDEADQMLEMGFIEDVQYVLDNLPEDRVTALFSATMPKPIVDLAQRYLRNPEMIRLAKSQGLTLPDIDQVFYMVPFPRKLDALCRVLDVKQPERTVVFCATKRMVDEVVEGLTARGYQSEALHGDISQAMRERVLRSFRSGMTEVLVATDVAARGLDVPEVSHVINFDIPPDPEYYVHRIGRTGRYGRRGEAITFVNPREMRILKVIERVTGAHIRRDEVPTAAEAEERETEILSARLVATLQKGGWGRYRPVIEELLNEDHDPVDVAAAALQLVATGAVGTRRVTALPSRPTQVPAPIQSAPAPYRPAPAPSPVSDVAPWEQPRPERQSGERPPFVRPAGDRPPFERGAGERPPFDRTAGPDERRPRREGDDRRPARDGEDRRPARDGDDRRSKNTGPWKPKRQVSFGKSAGKPGAKPGGKFVPRASNNAASGPARPPRPKRAR